MRRADPRTRHRASARSPIKAIQYTAFGTRPTLVEVDRPRPGPGEVLLRITACGARVGLTSTPYNMSVSTSLCGRCKELLELVEMARRGQIAIRTTTYSIDDGEQAYDDMHAGKIVGRAVVVP